MSIKHPTLAQLAFTLGLTAVLTPLLAIGAATLNPRLASSALFILLNFCNFMAIQERFTPDLAVFLNNNLSQFFGVFVAIYVTRAARSLSTASSARRLAPNKSASQAASKPAS